MTVVRYCRAWKNFLALARRKNLFSYLMLLFPFTVRLYHLCGVLCCSSRMFPARGLIVSVLYLSLLFVIYYILRQHCFINLIIVKVFRTNSLQLVGYLNILACIVSSEKRQVIVSRSADSIFSPTKSSEAIQIAEILRYKLTLDSKLATFTVISVAQSGCPPSIYSWFFSLARRSVSTLFLHSTLNIS